MDDTIMMWEVSGKILDVFSHLTHLRIQGGCGGWEGGVFLLPLKECTKLLLNHYPNTIMFEVTNLLTIYGCQN